LPPTHRLHLKLGRRDLLSPEEQTAFTRAVSRFDTVARGHDIVRQDVVQSECRIVVDGMAAHYRTLADGGRQITQVCIPGDFVDLPTLLLKQLDYSVTAITAVRLAVVPHEALSTLTQEHPHLGRLLWLDTLLQTSNVREWLVSSGRRSALAHLAHFFCEMLARYEIVGLAHGKGCPLPVTQADLADICGLTIVHTNRTLQTLRTSGLITWSKGFLTVHDREELERIADFDPSYLHVRHEPR
jgi:CRP-like cAMP-binding protein